MALFRIFAFDTDDHFLVRYVYVVVCSFNDLLLMKYFGWCGGLALSRHSHLLPERPVSVLANNNLLSRFSGLITLLALHLA